VLQRYQVSLVYPTSAEVDVYMTFLRLGVLMLTLHSRIARATLSSQLFVGTQAFAFMSNGPSNALSTSSFASTASPGMTHDYPSNLPQREYGYRIEPFTWPELIQIIDKENNLAKLSRSVPQQTEYEVYMRQLKSEWKTVCDYILHSKFGFEKRRSDENGLWVAYPPVSATTEPQRVLVLNDFPYYNAPGIYHYVLWKIGGDVTDQEIEEARRELCDSLQDVEGLLHWKNPPHLKSLPDIDHIHILCLRKSKGP